MLSGIAKVTHRTRFGPHYWSTDCTRNLHSDWTAGGSEN